MGAHRHSVRAWATPPLGRRASRGRYYTHRLSSVRPRIRPGRTDNRLHERPQVAAGIPRRPGQGSGILDGIPVCTVSPPSATTAAPVT
jgi:hypothetical protein